MATPSSRRREGGEAFDYRQPNQLPQDINPYKNASHAQDWFDGWWEAYDAFWQERKEALMSDVPMREKTGKDLIGDIEIEIQADRMEEVKEQLKEFYLEVVQARKTLDLLEAKFKKLTEMTVNELIEEFDVYP